MHEAEKTLPAPKISRGGQEHLKVAQLNRKNGLAILFAVRGVLLHLCTKYRPITNSINPKPSTFNLKITHPRRTSRPRTKFLPTRTINRHLPHGTQIQDLHPPTTLSHNPLFLSPFHLRPLTLARNPPIPPPPPNTLLPNRLHSPPSTSDPSPSPETLQSLLLPQTLSCRTAFDEAFYCNSFGGKFTDLYRHGEFRACSENWSKFWFCMRTRTFSSPQKENEIREFYRKREEGKYGRGRPSSEDVWESRERRVEWGTAFQAAETDKGEGMGMGMGDEEWNERERARRRAVVEGRS
ncbi:hypothetical protein HYALB_00009143 [Hymenoscyphus albidus]|uniref:Early meiotic induction protein 1 n=1 Tax=Hymenoscyphus albidus TaxID=595503 RepID=A0A9N9LVF5_9HELO|nr:hypothetical protein HYALB_00009143 [Hymenoscyphus albidus]